MKVPLAPGSSLSASWPHGSGWLRWPLPSFVHVPTMLNIGQFLDEELEEHDQTPWLLAYACALKCVGEAAEGRMWCPMGMCFIPKIPLLVDAFIEETGVELIELSIASCWGQPAMEVLLQKQDGPFADVIAFLDSLACSVPSWKVWDELVFPALLAEPSIPCRSTHLGYILGCMVDIWGALPPLRFHVTEPSGESVGVAHGLLFEGNILTFDPMVQSGYQCGGLLWMMHLPRSLVIDPSQTPPKTYFGWINLGSAAGSLHLCPLL